MSETKIHKPLMALAIFMTIAGASMLMAAIWCGAYFAHLYEQQWQYMPVIVSSVFAGFAGFVIGGIGITGICEEIQGRPQ